MAFLILVSTYSTTFIRNISLRVRIALSDMCTHIYMKTTPALALRLKQLGFSHWAAWTLGSALRALSASHIDVMGLRALAGETFCGGACLP
ncbi:hypothetical protein ABF162_26315 (plasmid) [Vibrio coralliilyticus]|uniref:hypothetical protein n=1 Tax=Vibrio coralliilyticus TaxID=190893 RepID=UPI0011863D99|nr:hypothetical protein [Vibrio coralliilyticus]